MRRDAKRSYVQLVVEVLYKYRNTGDLLETKQMIEWAKKGSTRSLKLKLKVMGTFRAGNDLLSPLLHKPTQVHADRKNKLDHARELRVGGGGDCSVGKVEKNIGSGMHTWVSTRNGSESRKKNISQRLQSDTNVCVRVRVGVQKVAACIVERHIL